MRILFISTFYPPYVVGGWEQLVQEINQQLQQRGHETHVLTSVHGVESPVKEDGVSRFLTLEGDLLNYKPQKFITYKKRVEANMQHTRDVIAEFNPDVVFIHIMWNLSRAIAWQAEQLMPGRVIFYMADHWTYKPDPHTVYWTDQANNPVLNVAKQIIAPIPLKRVNEDLSRFRPRFDRVLCVSNAIKDVLAEEAGIAPNNMRVVYNGIDTKAFLSEPRNRECKQKIRMLYAGSLIWHKGVHTAIQAMAMLSERNELEDMTLTIVGSGHEKYEKQLHDMVEDAGLETAVTFYGRVTREQMPDILKQYDVLIFPSTWEEPLARMVQEAMAAGLVVVGTTTGGTKEVLIEDKTGLTFPVEDAKHLSEQILRLRKDPNLLATLSQNGQKLILDHFDISRMIDEIEEELAGVPVA
jgi:glycosyltransferase involved in cell wall biosynthesis